MYVCSFEPLLDVEKEMEAVMTGSGESFMPGPLGLISKQRERLQSRGYLRVGDT